MTRTLTFVGGFLLTLAACVWATVALSRTPIEEDLTERLLRDLVEIGQGVPALQLARFK